MAEVTVLSETCSVFNVQKFRISDELLPATSHGRFATITTPHNTCLLCQIWLSKTLHPSFCYIDTSVCGHTDASVKGVYPVRKTVKSITLSDIKILPSVPNIKSATVSVVFSSPVNASKWKNQAAKLNDLVKNILKTFVIKSNSVVYLDGFESILNFEIYCVLIENIGSVSAGHVVSSTNIRISKLMSKITFEQIYTNNENVPVLGGLQEHLRTLTDLVKAARANREHPQRPVYKQVLLVGPPGCGKTAMVQRVAYDCGFVLKTIVGSELASPLPGEAERALTAVFTECRLLANESSGGCILLLEQVDSMCRRRDGSQESHVMRLTTHLYTLMETVNATPGLVVVGTTSQPQAMDQAVRRPGRFDHEIHIGVSTEQERESIVRTLTCRHHMCSSVSHQVAQWTPGFVGADLALLATNVARRLRSLQLPLDYDVEEEVLSHWRSCVGQMQPSTLRGQLGVIRDNKGSFSELGGVDRVRQNLQQAIEWPLTHPEAFKRLGLPNPKGVLLYGPPGCAKTSLVRAIATATNTTFLAVSAAQIYSPYVGDAERTIAELFHRARLGAPSILFIDEIDALVGCRGDREKGSQERILTAFLTEMDGVGVRLDSGTTQSEVGVVVVAATNRPDVLDPALTRPGRFDRHVYVGPPDSTQRLDILRTITKKMPLAADVDLPWLAEHTHLFSGADLNQLCKEAGLCALTVEGMSAAEVRHSHWLSALHAMRPSLSKEQLLQYQYLANTFTT